MRKYMGHLYETLSPARGRIVLHQSANYQSEKKERLHGKKNRSDRQPHGRAAKPEIVVRRTQDSAEEHQGGGKISRREARRQLKPTPWRPTRTEITATPKNSNIIFINVNHKPAPIIGHRKMGSAAEEQAEREGNHENGAQNIKLQFKAPEILVLDSSTLCRSLHGRQ